MLLFNSEYLSHDCLLKSVHNSGACRTNTLKPHKALQPAESKCESLTLPPVSVPGFCCVESYGLSPLQSQGAGHRGGHGGDWGARAATAASTT